MVSRKGMVGSERFYLEIRLQSSMKTDLRLHVIASNLSMLRIALSKCGGSHCDLRESRCR